MEDGGRRTREKTEKRQKIKIIPSIPGARRRKRTSSLSSSLCRVETSGIIEGPWCSSSVRGAGREERRANLFERTRGFGQLRDD